MITKKAKYIKGYSHRSNDLTFKKIYDVIEYSEGSILIENDQGIKGWYNIKGSITNKPLFEDATSVYRDEVINDILK